MDLQKKLLLKFLPNKVLRDEKRSDNYNANKLKTHVGGRFSGQVISIIPSEVGWKLGNSSFKAQEPTSPKVSCIGQIQDKHKHKHGKKIKESKQIISVSKYVNKKTSTTWSIFSTIAKQVAAGTKSHVYAHHTSPLLDRAPTLSQMKRFASGRDASTSLDWTSQIAPVESDCRSYYTDEDRSGETKEEEVTIPFLAPIWVGGGGGIGFEPRKEVNIWKRRTMAQPRPLQMNTLLLPN